MHVMNAVQGFVGASVLVVDIYSLVSPMSTPSTLAN